MDDETWFLDRLIAQNDLVIFSLEQIQKIRQRVKNIEKSLHSSQEDNQRCYTLIRNKVTEHEILYVDSLTKIVGIIDDISAIKNSLFRLIDRVDELEKVKCQSNIKAENDL